MGRTVTRYPTLSRLPHMYAERILLQHPVILYSVGVLMQRRISTDFYVILCEIARSSCLKQYSSVSSWATLRTGGAGFKREREASRSFVRFCPSLTSCTSPFAILLVVSLYQNFILFSRSIALLGIARRTSVAGAVDEVQTKLQKQIPDEVPPTGDGFLTSLRVN